MDLRTLALIPIIVPQAIWAASRVPRLPEAAGERVGTKGFGLPVRLLVLGDSSAAGVGVKYQTEALGGQLSDELGDHYSVEWTVVARSGGTVRSTLKILEKRPESAFDLVLVALGVNDAKNGVSLRNWSQSYRELLDTLTEKFQSKFICVSGLPPVRQFPALPRPLNSVLGDRAELFDLKLRQIVKERSDVDYLPTDFTLDTTKMARDGFHPGPEIYREWACRAARVFTEALAQRQL